MIFRRTPFTYSGFGVPAGDAANPQLHDITVILPSKLAHHCHGNVYLKKIFAGDGSIKGREQKYLILHVN